MPSRLRGMLWAAIVLGGVMAFLAQTSPDVARSNLSAWYEAAVGWLWGANAPVWLADPIVDAVFYWGGIGLVAAASLWLGVSFIARHQSNSPLPAVRAAINFVEKRLKYANEVMAEQKNIDSCIKKIEYQDVGSLKPHGWKSFPLTRAQAELVESVIYSHYEV